MTEPKTELLSMAEQLGTAQIVPEEACVVLGIDEAQLSGELLTAYRRGLLRAKFVVQLAVYEMAKQGSAPAQKQFLELASIAGDYDLDQEKA